MSAVESSAPLACALAASLAPTAFSTVAQLPSSAEVRSSRGASGQLSRPQEGSSALFCTSAGGGGQFAGPQEGPSAFFWTAAGVSFRLLKNSCHSASTDAGSCS